MKNKGFSQYRFSTNPDEQLFAEEWEEHNTSHEGKVDGSGILDYLLAENPNDPRGEVTDRDRRVAATVIQWLGSQCGKCFLRDVQEKIDKNLENKK